MSVALALAVAAAIPAGHVRLEAVGPLRAPGLVRRPMLRQRAPAGPADAYPAALRAAGQEAQVTVEIAVAADDRVGDCRPVDGRSIVTERTPLGFGYRRDPAPVAPGFADAACALLRRPGLVRHALGADGVAVAELMVVEVGFLLNDPGRVSLSSPAPFAGNRRPTPSDPALLRIDGADPDVTERAPAVAVAVDRKGRPGQCWITRSSGSDAADAMLCRHVGALRFVAARGPDEKPVAGVAFVRLELTP